MKRLLLVALLALLVTGGIAAVYHGPRPPVGEDANAAAKAARTKSHVLFDPGEYEGDGEPVIESFLKAFHLDLSYLRRAILPNSQTEPKPTPVSTEPKSPAPISESATPKPTPAATPPTTQPTTAAPNAIRASTDPTSLLSPSLAKPGIAPTLTNRSALGTNSRAPRLATTVQQVQTSGTPSPDLTQDRTNLASIAESYLSADPDRRATATSFLLALNGARNSSFSNPSWSRYFTLSPMAGDLAVPPGDDPSDLPAIPAPPDPLKTYSTTLDPAPPADANLAAPLAEESESVPEPRTLLLCVFALTLSVYRRSLRV